MLVGGLILLHLGTCLSKLKCTLPLIPVGRPPMKDEPASAVYETYNLIVFIRTGSFYYHSLVVSIIELRVANLRTCCFDTLGMGHICMC